MKKKKSKITIQMEKNKNYQKKIPSNSHSPKPSPRNSTREIFSIYKKKNLLRSSSKFNSNIQSSFLEITNLSLKYPSNVGFCMISQVSKLNQKYFSSITVETENKKYLNLIEDFIENFMTPQTINMTEALTFANCNENLRAYYLFGKTSKDQHSLQDKIVQSIRQQSSFQSHITRNLMFFHEKQYEILVRNILQHREIQFQINNKEKLNSYTLYQPENCQLTQHLTSKHKDSKLQFYFTKTSNNQNQFIQNKPQSLTQHRKQSNYQKILPQSQIQSYTMISQSDSKNTESNKFINLVHEITRKIYQNSTQQYQKQNPTRKSSKKKKTEKSAHKKCDRLSKNVTKKLSQINVKKIKSHLKKVSHIDCTQPNNPFQTKFNEISSILQNQGQSDNHILLKSPKSQSHNNETTSLHKNNKQNHKFSEEFKDFKLDNQYFHPKQYGLICIKTCSGTPNNHSRMPSQLFLNDENKQNSKSLKFLENSPNNFSTFKSGLNPLSKDLISVIKKGKKSKTASNSLLKINSAIQSGTSSPKIYHLHRINQKPKIKRSLDTKYSIKSQKSIPKSEEKPLKLGTKRFKDESYQRGKKQKKRQNKQNINKNDDFNEYGINFGGFKHKKSIVSGLIAVGDKKIGIKQREGTHSSYLKRFQTNMMRSIEKGGKIMSGNWQRSKVKKNDRKFGFDEEISKKIGYKKGAINPFSQRDK